MTKALFDGSRCLLERLSVGAPRRAVALLGVLLGALAAGGAPAVVAEQPLEVDRDTADADHTQEEIWDRFVDYLKSAGREDLAGAFSGQAGDGEADAGEGVAEAEEHAYPDFSRGDPIRGVLFRLSNDLVNLDALFVEDERRRLDPQARQARIASLIKRLKGAKNPYLGDYALYYEARRLLEEEVSEEERGAEAEPAGIPKERASKAARVLEKLVESPRFLGRREARRHLAGLYRRLGEDTLAILEIQFYLTGLSRTDSEKRLWAEEQLKEIRENHDGPLHDCADRSRSISTLLSMEKIGRPTQEGQREVEIILEKMAKLLEEMAGRCPQCNKELGKECKACKKQGKMCKACQSGKPCQACGSGMKTAQKSGDPSGTDPNDTPAQDTKIRRGDPGEAHLRDAGKAKKEPWGIINDRDVARSLREAWSKIPMAYRRLVAGYFKDITDIEPDQKSEKEE